MLFPNYNLFDNVSTPPMVQVIATAETEVVQAVVQQHVIIGLSLAACLFFSLLWPSVDAWRSQ